MEDLRTLVSRINLEGTGDRAFKDELKTRTLAILEAATENCKEKSRTIDSLIRCMLTDLARLIMNEKSELRSTGGLQTILDAIYEHAIQEADAVEASAWILSELNSGIEILDREGRDSTFSNSWKTRLTLMTPLYDTIPDVDDDLTQYYIIHRATNDLQMGIWNINILRFCVGLFTSTHDFMELYTEPLGVKVAQDMVRASEPSQSSNIKILLAFISRLDLEVSRFSTVSEIQDRMDHIHQRLQRASTDWKPYHQVMLRGLVALRNNNWLKISTDAEAHGGWTSLEKWDKLWEDLIK